MVDEATETGNPSALRDVKAELDERRIARGVALGLPLVTAMFALATGVMIGPAMAILVLAAGMLLGVIALFWASLRILSGDAALSPELEALDATAHAVDALSSRKRMLVRALKDLDNERALGKLEAEDHEQLSTTYRGELKEVLMRIDASLEPHRSKAEEAARSHLIGTGLLDSGYRGPTQPKDPAPADEEDADEEDADEEHESTDVKKPAGVAEKASPAGARVTCSGCATSNEIDASFCKKCGATLAKDAAAANANAKTREKSDEA
jgi:hypothetical protein